MKSGKCSYYIDNIKKALILYDPINAATYNENAEKYKAQITNVIGPLKEAILAIPEQDEWLVSCEGAFSYFTKDFSMSELYYGQ